MDAPNATLEAFGALNKDNILDYMAEVSSLIELEGPCEYEIQVPDVYYLAILPVLLEDPRDEH